MLDYVLERDECKRCDHEIICIRDFSVEAREFDNFNKIDEYAILVCPNLIEKLPEVNNLIKKELVEREDLLSFICEECYSECIESPVVTNEDRWNNYEKQIPWNGSDATHRLFTAIFFDEYSKECPACIPFQVMMLEYYNSHNGEWKKIPILEKIKKLMQDNN